MARHTYRPAGPETGSRVPRVVGVLLVWLAGLATGLYAMLGVGIRYAGTCNDRSTGLACRTGGTVIGAGLLVTVILTVSVATVITHAAGVRKIATVTLGALVVLALTAVGSHWLLGQTS